MEVFKLIFLLLIWSLLIGSFQYVTKPIQKKVKSYYRKIKFFFRRIYRLITIDKIENQVWKDLIKFQEESKWSFGTYEKERRIECSFKINDVDIVNFDYTVGQTQLTLRCTILQHFDEDSTDDIFVLASHFNNLLNFGLVKVSTKYNFVSYQYSRDLLVYSLYSGEICSDIDAHFDLAKDCFWAFKKLVETGEAPVFIISELLKRNDDNRNQNQVTDE